MQVARYRERHSTSGAKSDRGDAHVLAELVRLDRAHHRQIAGDSDLVEAMAVLVRGHQNLVWTRQRHTNQLRSMLRQYYPAALDAFDDLAGRDALAVLTVAPTPEQGRVLTVDQIRQLLREAGRNREEDSHGITHRTPARASRGCSGIRCVHSGAGVDHQRTGEANLDAGQRGGTKFWPAPGR
jgi:hypothetical protein